jgi:hypothetical protein
MASGWGSAWGRHWGKVSIVITEVSHVYTREIALALKLIKKKGQLVVWVKQNELVNNSQPWKTTDPGNPTTYPVVMVFLTPGGKIGNSEIRLNPGTAVPEGGPKALMGQVPFTPAMNDKVLRGSEWLVIKDVDIVAPNGEVILYKLLFA